MFMAQDRTGRTVLRRKIMWAAIAALLLLPALAMRFTREVNWTTFDFVAAAVLLVGTGLIFELVVTRMAHPAARMAGAALLLVALLLVWAQGAVGIV